MSGETVKLPVILRAIIGNQSKEFDVGLQHRANYTKIFSPYMLTIPLVVPDHVPMFYKDAYKMTEPVLLIEQYNKYEDKK